MCRDEWGSFFEIVVFFGVYALRFEGAWGDILVLLMAIFLMVMGFAAWRTVGSRSWGHARNSDGLFLSLLLPLPPDAVGLGFEYWGRRQFHPFFPFLIPPLLSAFLP